MKNPITKERALEEAKEVQEVVKKWKEESDKKVADLENQVDVLTKGSDALERRALEQAEELKKAGVFKEALIGFLGDTRGMVPGSNPSGAISASLERPNIELSLDRPLLPADDKTILGKLSLLIHDGFFDERKRAADVLEEFSNRGWVDAEKREVEIEMVRLCETAHLSRKISTGKAWWYSATADGKERVHVKS